LSAAVIEPDACTEEDPAAGGCVKTVGACDATWAPAAAMKNRRLETMGNVCFMAVILIRGN
jgi:hypothetical protein